MDNFRLFKQLFLISGLLFFSIAGIAQTRLPRSGHELKKITKTAALAGVSFSMPEGFKELNDKSEVTPFDFGMILPGQEFEVWFKILPKKNQCVRFPVSGHGSE